MLPAIVLVLITAVVAVVLYASTDAFRTETATNTPRLMGPNSIPIAMLPLINLSEDTQLEYVSSQVTNDIINELAKVRSFAVTAFSTIYAFQDRGKTPKEIAEELDVFYLMRGSARAYAGGDSIQIDVELVDPLTGRRLWGASYQEVMGDAPALQASIARKVATNLNVQLSPSENESLSGERTLNGQAYLKFLKARQEFQSLEIPRVEKAVSLLEEVLKLDLDYAEAHTLLAWALTLRGWPAFQVDQASLADNKEKIQYHLQEARRLTPESSDIYLVEANYTLGYSGDLKKAVELVEKALELNSWPELPTTLCICTAVTVNVVKGNLDRAKEIAHVARIVEPGNIMIINDAFFMDLVEGDIDGAVRNMEQALQLMDVPVFRYQTGWAYFHQGRYRESVELLERAYEGLGFTPPATLAYLSNGYYKLGELEKSEAYRDTLLARLTSGENVVLVDLASIAAVRGEDEKALRYLERSQEESIMSPAFQLNVDPVFDKYEQHPRFRALREKMNYFD